VLRGCRGDGGEQEAHPGRDQKAREGALTV